MTLTILTLGIDIVIAAVMICFSLWYVADTIAGAIKGIPGWKPYVDPKQEKNSESKDS